MVAQILVDGTINGAIYALLAIGFTLTFGAANILNLYHGTYYMLGAYFVYALLSMFSIPLIFAVIFSILIVMIIGVFLYYPIKILQKHGGSTSVLIFTLVASYFTQYLLTQIFGSTNLNIPSFINGSLNILGVNVAFSRLLALLISLIIIILISLFMLYARIGKEIVITAQDSYIAQILGINTNRVLIITIAISAMLAALAGIMISPFLTLVPNMWLSPLIMAFSIVILGGLGSIVGSIIAAFIIGYIQSGISIAISSEAAEIVILAVIILVIIFRPSGLLGKKID
jgi:branched-chain amino acid transport system permease protein